MPSGAEDRQAPCLVCDRTTSQVPHQASEKMFGRGGGYTYLECATCGTLRLDEPPFPLGDHYPPEYHAPLRAGAPPAASKVLGGLRPLATRLRLRNRVLAGLVVAGSRVVGFAPERWMTVLDGTGLAPATPVLDVGCGMGERLRMLGRHGFGDLTGVDAYLPAGDLPGDVRILRGTPQDVTGHFGLVMFHHAFEHMPDPVASLEAAHRLLEPGGLLLVRVPLAGCLAWRTYGTDWVQLDAPRHLHLHTVAGLTALAARAGFAPVRVVHDSDGFQFWGSELYRKGVALRGPGGVDDPTTVFGAAQVEDWERQARRLNRTGEADQAALLFRRGPPAPRP